MKKNVYHFRAYLRWL